MYVSITTYFLVFFWILIGLNYIRDVIGNNKNRRPQLQLGRDTCALPCGVSHSSHQKSEKWRSDII